MGSGGDNGAAEREAARAAQIDQAKLRQAELDERERLDVMASMRGLNSADVGGGVGTLLSLLTTIRGLGPSTELYIPERLTASNVSLNDLTAGGRPREPRTVQRDDIFRDNPLYRGGR